MLCVPDNQNQHVVVFASSESPHQLKRLSSEFVFRSNVAPYDADVVQFASGMDWATGGNKDRIVIAFGINDCEGAVVHVRRDVVESMLIPVETGAHAASYMKLVSSWSGH